MPTPGTVSATVSSGCSSYGSALSLVGASTDLGIAYQWQTSPNNSAPWTNATGTSTNASYAATIGANVYYRCMLTCTALSLTASTPGTLLTYGPQPASLPFLESFESTWLSCGSTNDIPNFAWVTTPVSGNRSWRREDETTANSGWSNTSGGFSPSAVSGGGSHAARFHSWSAASGNQGSLDLYVNFPAGTKSIRYNTINTTGTDVLNLLISLDNGATFTSLDGPVGLNASGWVGRTVTTTAVPSAGTTAILRWQATSDNGATDIGLDSIYVSLLPTVIASPSSLAFGNVNTGATTTLSTVLSASGLNPASGNLTITAPTGYYIWTGSSAVTTTTVAYSGSGGVITTPTLVVQFAPTAVATYNASITITGGGLAGGYNIPLTGNGANPCTGVPTAGTASATATSGCTAYSTTLSLPTASLGSDLTYQWYSGTDGVTYGTTIAGATNSTYIGTVSSGIYYRATVTCPTYGTTTSGGVFCLAPGTILPPYAENFDASSSLPCGWLIVDNNGNTTWSVGAALATGGTLPNAVFYTYNTVGPADDWLFTKGLNLTAGVTYNIDFKYGSNSSTTYFEKLEVKYGTTQSIAGMTSAAIFSNTAILTSSAMVSASTISITPVASGTYYLGFHAFSATDQNKLYVDDFSIVNAPATVVPTPTSLAFGNILTGAVSGSQTITISGANLTNSGSLTITASSGYEINNGSGWSSTYNYNYSGTSFSSYSIPVHFAPVSGTSYPGSVTISGGGLATPITITFSGTGVLSCSALPVAGAASATATIGCAPNYATTLSLSGATAAAGLTYQWYSGTDGVTYGTTIAGATDATYSVPSVSSAVYYRADITCPTYGTATSSGVLCNTPGAAIAATLPFTEIFESTWVCGTTRNLPNFYWSGTPTTGNASWRREDDGASAGWSSTSGAYSPVFSAGAHSARFHTWDAGTATGSISLYVNFPAGNKQIKYDYVNTGGADQLKLQLSLDNGATFTDIDVPAIIAASFTTRTVTTFAVPSVGTTAILRWTVTGDAGASDVGLDNIQITQLPSIVSTPSSLTFPTTATGSTTTLSTVLSGVTLTPASGTLTVTAPTGFYIWTGSSAVTSTTISYSGSGATITPSTFSVQFAPTAATTYTGNVTITGGGIASTYSIAVSGIGSTPCSAIPTAGATAATTTASCAASYPTTLSLPGATVAAGLTYQWYSGTDGITYGTTIAGATNSTYSATVTSGIYYRATVTCPTFGTATSTGVACSAAGHAIATIPFNESFETTWISCGATNDIPNYVWTNNPATGNASWRRDDDGASAGWSSTSGAYSPVFSAGAHSARFHTWDASTSTATLSMGITFPVGLKQIKYDYVNTGGAEQLKLQISLDGTTFTDLDVPPIIAATFTTRTVTTTAIPTTGTTAILRWTVTGDGGATDVGLDNIQISLLPSVIGAPSSLAFGAVNTGSSVTLSTSLTGVSLTPASGTVTVNGPGGYLMSTGGAFSNPLTINYTSGAFSSPLIVQFNPSAVLSYDGTITISGGGLSTPSVITLTGSGVTPCVGTPTPGTVLATVSSGCAPYNTTLSLGGGVTTGYSGLSYQWKSSVDGISYGNVGGATSSTYALNNSTIGTTYYKCEITCASSSAIQASGQALSFTPVTTFPYLENFDAVTSPALPCGWTTADVNGDGDPSIWTNFAGTATGSSAPNMLSYRYHLTNTADDWAFTPAIYCTAGNTYKLTFNYGNNGGTTYVEKLEVKYGSANTVAGMTTSLYANTAITNTTLASQSVSFVAASTGLVYYGFHCNSGADMNRLFIDDIKVEQFVPCAVPAGSPTALSCAPAVGITTVISFTPPSPVVDSYLVVASTSTTLSSSPVSGTNYAIGAALGGGVVIAKVAAGSSVTLTTNPTAGLAAATAYNVFMYSYNGISCIGTQPVYKTTLPGVSTFTTCVTPPAAPTTSSTLPAQGIVSWVGGIAGATNYTVNLYTNSIGTGTPAYSWTSPDASATSYLFTGIAGGAYFANVVANTPACGASSPLTIMNVPFSEPYFESFETISTQNAIPFGWAATANTGTYVPKYGNGASIVGPVTSPATMPAAYGSWDYVFVGKHTSTLNTNDNNWLVSPGVYLTPGTYTLGFDYRQDWNSSGGPQRWSLAAFVTNSNSVPAATTATPTGTSSGTYTSGGTLAVTGWNRATTGVTITTTGIYYVQIDAIPNANASLLMVDNISICKTPSAGTVTANPTALCAGSNVSLSASPVTAGYNYYSWSGPGGYSSTGINGTSAAYNATATYTAIPLTASGIYTVTIKSDPLSTPVCAITSTVSVAVLPTSPAAMTPIDTTICTSGSYTLGGGNVGTASMWSVAPAGYATVSLSGVVSGISESGMATPVTITYNSGCGGPAVSTTVKTLNSLSGTYNIGVGQPIKTLSQAAALYNCATSLTGPVVFQLTDATYPSETFPITISSNAAASATNTLTIRPASGISPTISGSASFAIFGINGKYITLEGSNNPVANTICPLVTASRNLTIQNTNTSTSSAVIWMGAGSNNNIQDCNINGSSSTQTLVGIGSGGAAIALNSLGNSNNNNSIVNNAISAVQNGIYSMGASAGTKNTGTVINQNVVTNTSNNGIMVGFESGINIKKNVVTGVSSATSGRDVVGINVGFANNSIVAGTTSVTGNEVADAVIEKNIVGSITSTASTGAQSAVGIAVAGSASGTANTIVNNSVYKMLSLSSGSDITAGLFLSGITSGVSSKVWYNTVALTGTPGVGTNPSFALAVSGIASPVDIKNNILVNAMWNGTANSARAMGFAYNTYSGLTSNYNVLRDSSAAPVFVAVGSLTAPTSTYASISAWQTGSGSTQDANSVLAIPVFNAPTAAIPNLGLSYAVANVAINNAGTPLTYTSDANCITRDASTPDIGISEFNGSAPPPAIAYVSNPSGNSCPTNQTVVADITINAAAPVGLDDGSVTGNGPKIYFSKNGTTWFSGAGTYVSGSTAIGGTSRWNFIINATTLGLLPGETVSYYLVAQDLSTPVVVGSLPVGVLASSVAAITTAPVPTTYSTYIASGTVAVGVGQTFTSLPAAVANYSASTCITGPVVLSLTDALYSMGSTSLTISGNASATATNTLTIQPAAGVSTTISSSNSTGTVFINGGKYIIIDGTNTTVTNSICPAVSASRNLTITNSSTGAVVWMATGTNNSKVQNCNITGNGIASTLIGIGSGGATPSLTSTGNANHNNSIINNRITAVGTGIYSMGSTTLSKNSGTIIDQNVMTAANGIGSNCILVGNENGINIRGNNIGGINSSASADVGGIIAGFGNSGILFTNTTGSEVSNATITNNIVDNINQSNTWSAVGIALAASSTGTSTIANNMVTRVFAKGTSSDFSSGIFIGGGLAGAVNLFYNSVYITGSYTGAGVPSYALAVSGTNPVITMKNNIFVYSASNGVTGYAAGFASSTFSNVTSSNNDFFSNGNLIGSGSLSTSATSSNSIAAWFATSGKDQNSLNVNPTFTSVSDLHLTSVVGNALLNDTGAVVAITSDLDCNTRDILYPDLGISEFTPPGCNTLTPLAGTASPATPAFCTSGSSNISVSGQTIDPTFGTVYYKWASSSSLTGPFTNIGSAVAASYSTAVLSSTTYYQFTDSCANTRRSGTTVTSVRIDPLPTGGTIVATPATLCPGSGVVVTLSQSGVPSGPAGAIATTYNWSGPNGYTATTAATNASFIPTTTAASGLYSLTVTYNEPGCISPAVTYSVSVNSVPTVASITAPSGYCLGSGSSITLTGVGASGTGPVTSYNWSGPAAFSTTTALSSVSFTPSSTTASGVYSLTVSYTGAGCVSAPVTSSTVTVADYPTVFNLTGGSGCSAAGITIGVDGSQTSDYTYALKRGATTVATLAGTTTSLSYSSVTAAGTYSVVATGPGGCQSNMTGTSVVATTPSASVSAAMPNICQPTTSASIGLSSIVGSPTTYSVNWNTTALSDGGFSNILAATLSGSSVTLIYNPTGGAGSFDGTLTLSNGACASTPYPVHTIVHAEPHVSVAAVNVPCVGYAGSIDFTGTDSATVSYSKDGAVVTSFSFNGTTHNLSTGVITFAHNYLIIDAHNAVCTTAVGTTITIDPTPMAWVGGTGGAGHESEWNRSTNWSCGFVPTVSDDVAIQVAAFNPVIPSAFTATTRNLTVSSGGVLVIDGSGELDVKGSLNNSNVILGNGKVVLNGSSAQVITGIGTANNLQLNNSMGATINTGSRLVIGNTLIITSGTLTTNDSLELASSDTNATARIAAIPSVGAAISGKVKADQYVMGGYRRFRFFAHPFSDTMSLSQLQPYIDITGPGGTANGFRYTASNAPSAFRLDPYTSNSSLGYDPGWKPFTKINAGAADTNKVHPGQGIRVFFRGSKGEGLGYSGYIGGYTPSATTFKMMGNVNQGNVSVSLAQGTSATLQSYNMVGNPYPSPVDMGTIIWNARNSGQAMGGAFFVFDPAMGAGGQFVSVNLGGSAVPYYVQANTCIQVQADHDGAHIEFTEADKSPNTSNYLYKAPVQYTSLNVYDEKYHLWDMLKINFNENATDENDKMLDAAKPMGVADFNFYSKSADNLKLAVDSRPFAAEKVIPLGLTSGYQQNFIIRTDNVVVPAGGKLVLHDKLLGRYVDMNQGTEYAFTIGKDKATQGDRFELALKSNVPTAIKPLAVTMTPNPTTDDVKISFTSGKKEKVTVRVMDISGVSIYNQDLGEQKNGTISVPLSTFAAGIYMVELTQGEQKVTQRLVKE
ncbi:hypothetical protein CJD36_005065 [Flavipsychrobacter stenotrophus]|uniref:Secretion system C-terminal sorting domain-containing protein n=2 Tax=Flavipsychrobacter stenotrophus TaxID=2077091 RepID=A0A2S7T2T6_9BACT|nr:hypothetical protein CJD36_005065 [Flavipsychrobacter stenotrophus]